MLLFFYSNKPVAIKSNGEFMFNINKKIKKLLIDDNLNLPVIEVIPLFGGNSVYFSPNAQFLTCPTADFSVCNLKNGYLININLIENTKEFIVYSQYKSQNYVATLFNFCGVKLSLECEQDFYLINLSHSDTTAEYYPIILKNKNLLGIKILGSKTRFLLFSKNNEGKIKLLFNDSINLLSLSNGIYIEKRYLDILKHKVSFNISLSNTEEIVYENKKIERENREIDEKILPYAFLEEILVKGDLDAFISEKMAQNKNKLFAFFGDFISVFIPQDKTFDNAVGLVYKEKERCYFIKYFSFEIINGKIHNIFPLN